MNHDEELQKRIEEARFQDNEQDEISAKAYQKVFSVLNKNPSYDLSADFADRIVQRVNERQTTEFYVRDYFWFGAGILFMVVGFGITVYITGFTLNLEFDLGFLKSMSGYKGLFIFGVAFILLLNWMDKRLLRGRHLHLGIK